MPACTSNIPSCRTLRTVTTTRALWLLRDRNISLGSWILPAFPFSVMFSILGPCGGEQGWGIACWQCHVSAQDPPTFLQAQIQPCPGGVCSAISAGAPRAEGENLIPRTQQQRGRIGTSFQESPKPPSLRGAWSPGTSREWESLGMGRECKVPHVPPLPSLPPDHPPAAGTTPQGGLFPPKHCFT